MRFSQLLAYNSCLLTEYDNVYKAWIQTTSFFIFNSNFFWEKCLSKAKSVSYSIAPCANIKVRSFSNPIESAMAKKMWWLEILIFSLTIQNCHKHKMTTFQMINTLIILSDVRLLWKSTEQTPLACILNSVYVKKC